MPHCGREGVLCWTVSHLSCQVLAFQESKRYQMCLLVNKCLYIFLFLQKLLYCNVMNKQLGTLNNVFFLKLLIGNFVWFVGCVSSTYLLLLLSQQLQCISKWRVLLSVLSYCQEFTLRIHSSNLLWRGLCMHPFNKL